MLLVRRLRFALLVAQQLLVRLALSKRQNIVINLFQTQTKQRGPVVLRDVNWNITMVIHDDLNSANKFAISCDQIKFGMNSSIFTRYYIFKS